MTKSGEQGDFYWQKAFSKLAIDAYGRPSEENNHPIYEDIAFLQMIGYHSKKFKSSVGLKHLPSTIFTNLLIKFLAVETDKTFLVLRSETLTYWAYSVCNEKNAGSTFMRAARIDML